MDDIEAKVRAIIGENSDSDAPFEEIGLDDDLTGFGITSVEYIKIVVALEVEFDIEFEDENLDVSVINNLGKLLQYIREQLETR